MEYLLALQTLHNMNAAILNSYLKESEDGASQVNSTLVKLQCVLKKFEEEIAFSYFEELHPELAPLTEDEKMEDLENMFDYYYGSEEDGES